MHKDASFMAWKQGEKHDVRVRGGGSFSWQGLLVIVGRSRKKKVGVNVFKVSSRKRIFCGIWFWYLLTNGSAVARYIVRRALSSTGLPFFFSN